MRPWQAKTRPPVEIALRRELPDRVAHSHDAGHRDPAVGSAQAQLAADRGVDEPEGIVAVARLELCAARVWGLAELDHRRPDLNPAAGRQVRDADVEVDVKLVAGKGPTVAVAGDGGGRSRVHDGQLRIRTRTAVRGPAAAATAPGAAFHAVDGIESNFGEYLPLVHGRPPDDQLECPRVRPRIADGIEAP